MQMDVHKTLYPFYLSTKMLHVMATFTKNALRWQQQQDCNNLQITQYVICRTGEVDLYVDTTMDLLKLEYHAGFTNSAFEI